MSEQPKATVVTPAYNVGKWIGEAIDSVLAQTEKNFEYLVVDDGSDDNTIEVVKEKASADDRLRLIEGGRQGQSQARNRGIGEAQGTYVAFLDGDDRWDPTFLESQLRLIESLPAEVGAVFCHTRAMDEEGNVISKRLQPSGRYDFDRMLVENCPPHNGSPLLLRRSVFNEAGVFSTELKSAVDWDMWLRICSESSTPIFWSQKAFLIDMRLMRTGSISSNRGARFEALEELLSKYSPKMGCLHPGTAYVRPAILAFRDGFDDIAEGWAAKAKQAPLKDILKDPYGPVFLVWSSAGRSGRTQLRKARAGARSGAFKAIGLVKKLKK